MSPIRLLRVLYRWQVILWKAVPSILTILLHAEKYAKKHTLHLRQQTSSSSSLPRCAVCQDNRSSSWWIWGLIWGRWSDMSKCKPSLHLFIIPCTNSMHHTIHLSNLKIKKSRRYYFWMSWNAFTRSNVKNKCWAVHSLCSTEWVSQMYSFIM